MLALTDSIRKLHHIGAKTEAKLKRLGIQTVSDLLWHLPQRYEDLSHVLPIGELQETKTATIRGTIDSLTTRRSFRKRMAITEMRIADKTGTAQAIWFNQPYIQQTLKVGDEVYLSGKIQTTLLEKKFISPMYEKVKEEQIHTAHIIPFYSLTEGLTHKQLRFLIQTALKQVSRIDDFLPPDIIESEQLPSLAYALHHVHFPKSNDALRKAIKRLKFEELFWLQLGVGYTKKFFQQKKAPSLDLKQKEVAAFVGRLPFHLTDDQKRAAWQILKDLNRAQPMNRLVQGDVGCGKTVVASIAILNTALSGHQSMLMAPTEILALQHFTTLRTLLPNLRIALLTSKQAVLFGKQKNQGDIARALFEQEIDAIVGTHSLIQEGITVKKLGLVIIDEQHRFGVAQRQRLTTLNLGETNPHLLSLSATPIPRSLALTLYGDLDISRIRTMPQGRLPVITKIVTEAQRDRSYAFIKDIIAKKQQVFILCPVIFENDATESKAVLTEYERLQNTIFKGYEVRYLHGRLKSREKEKIIDDFKHNRFPLLVTTSVIEVGIDIPNATIMMIEGAERFGLAQLHQFRGRVGRNSLQSYCLLFTDSSSEMTMQRLQLLCDHHDGFLLAEADLKMRGEGELFGTKQSGILNFKIATIHDVELIKTCRRLVDTVVEQDADLAFYATVKDKLRHAVLHAE